MAPVSSSAPGRDDCPALIPALIIFKAAWIYITLMQAPVAPQLPQEAAFQAFASIAWVGGDCYHGCEQHLDATEASGQPVGFESLAKFGLLHHINTWCQLSVLRNDTQHRLTGTTSLDSFSR